MDIDFELIFLSYLLMYLFRLQNINLGQVTSILEKK